LNPAPPWRIILAWIGMIRNPEERQSMSRERESARRPGATRRWLRATAGIAAASITALAAPAPAALADFPYLPRSGGDLHNPATWHLAPGEAPSNYRDDWKLAGTPDTPPTINPSNPLTITEHALVLEDNAKADELCGVRGASIVDDHATIPAGDGSCLPDGSPVRTAFMVSTGRPDVTIAVLDSGIKWNDAGAMTALRFKVHLNQGELPAPRHDLATPLIPGVSCGTYGDASGGDYNPHGNYDLNGDGVLNVRDYACDSRVAAVVNGPGTLHDLRHGPPGTLTPEDLILAFTDGTDHDHNGYANDIAGWNFVDDNNDPYDDVQYGHGTGEAEDSNAEANTNQGLGTCPNCMVLPLRVGESFIADVNRFAQAVLYATDSGAYVVQEALGTLNNSLFARQAIEYAYHHGTVVIASAADEAAEHHNQPGALPDAIVVNSVTKYASTSGVPLTGVPASYLQFNGCTNFGTRVTLAVPSSSCSSEATGKSSGVAGLIYSAALNAIAAGRLAPATDCRRVDGSPCPITPNEVRQLLASGNIAGAATAGAPAADGRSAADAGAGAQADDVNFAQQPELSCSPLPAPGCTDPNLNTVFNPDTHGGVDLPAPDTRRYHARRGWDEFYGYGRLDAFKAVSAAAAGTVPPEADIESPDWFQQLDPASGQLSVTGYVSARRAYTCRVEVAPGAQPNNEEVGATPPGDFAQVASSWCDGRTVRSTAFEGTIGTIDTAALRARFPVMVQGFSGNENGGTVQTSNGRPNTLPYAFTVRVVVSVPATGASPAMTGEDRRQLFLHRDRDALPGFPKELRTDGASSPLLVDLDGDNRNELVVATSDGVIHAWRANGTELPGWPVHTVSLPLHPGAPAYRSVGTGHYQAVLGALAAGDLFGDGRIEIVADDLGGNVYAWDAAGRLVFHQASNPAFSGAPLTPFHTVRQGPRDRTERGFLASPVLARLSGARTGPLDIIAAGEDRHLYAWHASGAPVAGFPVLVADPDKLTGVDPATDHLSFSTTRARPNPGIDEDQGKIVDTPAVATIGGKPAIIVGSNEEYGVGTGDEGQINAGDFTAASLGVLGQTGLLSFANGRVYAIKATGGTITCAGGTCHSTAYLPGWPKKVGIIDQGLLPDVGEGINGSPVVAPLTCPRGGAGMKIGVTPDAGPAYIFNANGSSCYGTDQSGHDNPLEVDVSVGHGQYDHPAFAAVGYPAFGTIDGHTTSFFAPEAGVLRALDVVVPDYQGGQDFIGGWDPSTGQSRLGFPAEVNDLQFLTGPAVGDVTGGPGQEVIGGTASLDLAAFNAAGLPASTTWPKLTGDWTIATPTLGSFGSLDDAAGARKDVVSITRSGTLIVYRTPAAACSPSSSPRFHHDIANSGDYTRDAVPPGRPYAGRVRGRTLRFRAPGGDLLCGTAASYQLVTSDRPITPETFASATSLAGAPRPLAAGRSQSVTLPASARRFIAIRAVDAAGNLGLPLVVDLGGRR
jgi:hypothetical protein